MIFPRERVVHENLSTSFTQLDAMLTELKTDLFTGYVRLALRDYEGVVFLDGGRVVNALEDAKGQRRNGTKAFESVVAKSRERDGMLSVFQLSSELTNLLASLSGSHVLYKDLASDLTGLDKLLSGLQGRRYSGHIDVQLAGGRESATIFLRDGDVLEAALSRQGVISDGPMVLDQIIRASAGDGAVFTVYGVEPATQEAAAKPANDTNREEHLALWQDVLKTVEAAVDGAAKPGTFAIAFRRASVEMAETAPFLDPFADEFEYRDGQIRCEAGVGPAELHQGLSRCLAACIRTLAAQSATRDVVTRLSSPAAALKKRHGQRLAAAGLAETLPDLFGG